MEDDFKIILPPHNPQENDAEKAYIRGWFNKASKKPACKVFVFLNMFGPLSASDLAKKLGGYYRRPYSAADVHYICKQLIAFGLACEKRAIDVLDTADRNKNDRLIFAKYQSLLRDVPEHMQTRFRNTIYYFVSEYGKEFVPFVAEKCLGFKVERNNGNLQRVQ